MSDFSWITKSPLFGWNVILKPSTVEKTAATFFSLTEMGVEIRIGIALNTLDDTQVFTFLRGTYDFLTNGKRIDNLMK